MPKQGIISNARSSSNQPLVQTGRTYETRPMIRRMSNEEIERQRLQKDQVSFDAQQNQPVISSLASHIRASFTAAVSAKQTTMTRMLKCLRQREGIYEADIQALINQQNGTNIYMMITDVKCRALESWLKDIMLPSGERPYALEPTPVPDIPPQLVEKSRREFLADYLTRVQAQAGTAQIDPSMIDLEDLRQAAGAFRDQLLKQIKEMAEEDADRLEDQVDDELTEGKWYETLSDFIEDFSTYPTAFMEGPTFRKRPVMEWVPIEGTMMHQINIVQKVVKEYDRIDPYDVYPSPGAKTLQDGDLSIRKRFSRRDLNALKGVDGFDETAINQVLERYGRGGYREFISFDTEIAGLHDRPNEWQDVEGHIDGIKFFGSVQGFMLREWGMPIKEVPDPYREYSVIAYLVGSFVIGARLNPHPLKKRNVYSASFRKKNGSIWGKSPPELMRDIQNICNSSARAICNNAAMASGPQVWQLVDLIPPEVDRTEIFPWKIWPFSSEKLQGTSGPKVPMGFYQPRLIVQELLAIYKYFFEQASEVTGIPAYVYGGDSIGGAGKTASGLSMLMNAAAKGLRNSAKNIDMGVISPSVHTHWLTLILMNPEMSKGDIKIVARASEYLIQQEQLQIRRQEFLNNTANPFDMQILGIDGRSELLRENARSLHMNVDKVIPKREDMIQTQVQQAVQQVVMTLAQALGVAPEQIMGIIQQGQGGGGGNPNPEKPNELDAAGNPVGGGDVRRIANP